MIMWVQNLVKFCPFIRKILRQNQILTSIKGCNSIAKLGKMACNNPNIDLINDNVYTKFNSVHSSSKFKHKPNSDINQGL